MVPQTSGTVSCLVYYREGQVELVVVCEIGWAEALKGVSWKGPPGAAPPPVLARASWEAQLWPRGEKEEQRGGRLRGHGEGCMGWAGTAVALWHRCEAGGGLGE